MTAPTTEQYAQYDRLISVGVDPDVAAYLTDIDECACVMPHQSCRICRGAAKAMAMEPTFDEALGEYVAQTLVGCEVYGQTRAACDERLREANRVVTPK